MYFRKNILLSCFPLLFMFPDAFSQSRPRNDSVSKFQFLNGSIKSEAQSIWRTWLTPFQFLNGSIKRWIFIAVIAVLTDFNSSMVRLKVDSWFTMCISSKDFNSSMVRLKVQRRAPPCRFCLIFQFLNGSIKSVIF